MTRHVLREITGEALRLRCLHCREEFTVTRDGDRLRATCDAYPKGRMHWAIERGTDGLPVALHWRGP